MQTIDLTQSTPKSQPVIFDRIDDQYQIDNVMCAYHKYLFLLYKRHFTPTGSWLALTNGLLRVARCAFNRGKKFDWQTEHYKFDDILGYYRALDPLYSDFLFANVTDDFFDRDNKSQFGLNHYMDFEMLVSDYLSLIKGLIK